MSYSGPCRKCGGGGRLDKPGGACPYCGAVYDAGRAEAARRDREEHATRMSRDPVAMEAIRQLRAMGYTGSEVAAAMRELGASPATEKPRG